MKTFLQNFEYHLNRRPDSAAIVNAEQSISYCELADEISSVSKILGENQIQRLAISLTNSAAFICLDLAAVSSKITSITIPHFFTAFQIEHLLDNAGADAAVVATEHSTGAKFHNRKVVSARRLILFGKLHWLIRFVPIKPTKILPADALKISYTSGSTGQPKGVVICGSQVDKVITSLAASLNASDSDRHISVLPYSLLLENIAGIYTVLAAGGQCIVPKLSELGFSGSSSVDINQFIESVSGYQPTTMITVPALSQAIVIGIEQSGHKLESLRFIAAGGAPLSRAIIQKAQKLGLPLYEGYGLTEACSVVSLNTVSRNKIGSVGKPLDHAGVSISDDGEILVSGTLCAGYIDGNLAQDHHTCATGDLGHLDGDGFLYITGRKRTCYCTAYGRNISPEWVESELSAHPKISQAIIYGQGKNFNIAIIVPRGPISEDELKPAVASVNRQLPDYARISRWFLADEPYSVANGQLSKSGVIQRSRIIEDYKYRIQNIYQ